MWRYDWPGNVRELSNMIRHWLSVLYPRADVAHESRGASMLPVGMAELVTETSDSEQGSLFGHDDAG